MDKTLSLLYHEITDEPSLTGFQRKKAFAYKHTKKEFFDHLKIYNKNLSFFNDVCQLDFSSKSILVTFDDGGKSNIFAANELKKMGIIGHFFIVTSLIGRKGFLSANEIKKLHKQGHVIGSHSHTHPNVFNSLNRDKMIYEWAKSKEILENIVKEKIICCSIPGGDSNLNAFQTAGEIGFDYVFSSDPSFYPVHVDNTTVIGRVSLKKGDSLKKINRIINFKGIFLEIVIRKIKVIIKLMIYPFYSKIHNKRNNVN